MKPALEILGQYKADIDVELEKHLPRDGEPFEFYASVWDLIDRGGKRFRPALTFLACECVGGKKEDAVGAAAAIELLHNMTLVHDDIEDQSELRRGKPCIHKIYGVPSAINSGDAMLIKVFEIANSSKIPAERCQRLVAKIADRAYGITWGQAFEFSMWERKNFTEEDVIRLLRFKTGALTGLSTEGGAIAGGGSQEQLEILGKFGETVGIAFQIVDDLLNVKGDVKEYGKEIGGDIREGKKTVLAAHLLKAATPQDKKVFGRLLGKKNVKKNEIRQVIGLYEKYGSTEYAKTQADTFLENAMKTLNRLPPSEARNSLSSIADFLVSRSF
ncbi:MAG: polyprenyl synthetase family protein [Candidatus Bathyarchaeia archaeon]|jgi:geranylgeranyl diphosphate synthase type I